MRPMSPTPMPGPALLNCSKKGVRAGAHLVLMNPAMFSRAVVCVLVCASVLLAAGMIEAKAEGYPNHSVTLVVPWLPGNSPV